MERGAYIIAVQKIGWLLFSSNAEGLVFRCGAPGCREAILAPEPMIVRGELPEPCPGSHAEGQGVTVESYQDAMTAIADARRRLGLDQSDAGAAAGLADGHTNKCEAGHRHATLPVLLAMAATVGYAVTLTPAPVPKQAAKAVEDRMARPMMARWRAIPMRRLGHDRAAAGLFRLRRVGDGEVAA